MAKSTTTKKQYDDAAAVAHAAAGIATNVIATAAVDATRTLAKAAQVAAATVSEAAEKATRVVAEAAAKTLAEFPALKEDIREIRSGQLNTVHTLTTVMTELLDARATSEKTWQKGVDDSLGEIKDHMEKQNGRLAKAETHIIRQNLVIFGVAGPLCLALAGYLAHAYILAHNIFSAAATLH